MFKKIHIKKNVRVNIESIPPRKDISTVGIVYNSKLSSNYSIISNAFHNINIIDKTISLNCSNVEYDMKSLSHNLISLSHKCDFMIVIDIQTIPIRILDNISKRCRTMFFSFENNIQEIPRKSYTARFLSRFHYRASSSYDTCEIIAERCDAPVYHVQNGINTKIFFPIIVKKLYDVGFIGDKNKEVDETLAYLREKGIKIKAIGKGFPTSNPSNEEQRNLYGQSHFILDLNKKEISLNIWNSLACKSFLITKKINGIENLSHGLTPNIHFAEFQSHSELINQINYYKFDETKREQIKTAGYKFITENRTWAHFAKEIIQIATSETGILEIPEAGETFSVPNRLLLGTVKQYAPSEKKGKIMDVSSIGSRDVSTMIYEQSVESKISIEFNRSLSIIIPYMHNPKRFPLLVECLKTLPNPRNSKNVEICIHEVGKSRVLNPKFVKNFKYCFTKFEGVFDRAWAINTGVRKLATGERLLIIDSDLIVTPQWFEEIISSKNKVYIAWGLLYCLTLEETNNYLKTHQLIEKRGRTKWPSLRGSSGAATLIDRKVFDVVKGIPEDFSGTWGGEDNAFLSKLKELGFPYNTFSSKIYHLYHDHKTPFNREISRRNLPILRWGKEQWMDQLGKIGDNWGKDNQMEIVEKIKKKIVDLVVLDERIVERVLLTKEPLLTISMFSWIRVPTLLRTLETLLNRIIIPINIFFRMQGRETLKDYQIFQIEEMLKQFNKYEFVLTDGNVGSGPPRLAGSIAALEFNTPYIMTMDDDLLIPPGAIEAEISFLEQFKKFGAVSLWCQPEPQVRQIIPNRKGTGVLKAKKLIKPIDENVDVMGSATMIARREVFETCQFDPEYFVGWQDFDFCIQMKENNWRLAVLSPNEFLVQNCGGGGSSYTKVRNNTSIKKNSLNRFKSKWRHIEVSR